MISPPVHAGQRARAGATSIMETLREATRGEHEWMERSLDLKQGSLSVESYVRLLELLYGYYEPVERRLQTISELSQLVPDLDRRRKVPLLVFDLHYWKRDERRLPLCSSIPMIFDRLDALGSLYVLEGATLGGQVLSRWFQNELGITADTGGAFFHGYGSGTTSMWRAFGSSMATVPQNTENDMRIIESARATFRTLRMWCLGA